MALIYASAVNKRINQLQKKRSMDIPPTPAAFNTNEQLAHQQLSYSYSTKGRPTAIRRNEYGTVRMTGRDCPSAAVGEGRKRSAPPAANRCCASAPSAERVHLIKLSPVDSGHKKPWRKLTVAGDHFSTDSHGQNAATGNPMDTTSPCRKISMPLQPTTTTNTMVMMMGTMAMNGIGGGSNTAGRMTRSEVVMRPKQLIKSSNSCSSNSSRSYGTHKGNEEEEEDENDDEKNGRGRGIFAQLTSAFRRRSVSMDEQRVFRRRHGTLSSPDSVSGSPSAGEECASAASRGGAMRQQRKDESNAFRKMRDRLNRWKFSTTG